MTRDILDLSPASVASLSHVSDVTVSKYILLGRLCRWNYKQANCENFSELVIKYTQWIRNKQQTLNETVKAQNQDILTAASETIPQGARKNHQPCWTRQLQELEDSVEEARTKVEDDPIPRKQYRQKQLLSNTTRSLFKNCAEADKQRHSRLT